MALNNAINSGTIPLIPEFGGTGTNAVPANGQIPIGDGTNYVAASITAGTGITITPGAGSLVIAAVGGGNLSWSTIAGTTQAAAVNSAYIVGNAAQTTITLPVTAAAGSIVAVQGLGAAGWIIQANAGQTVHIGQTPTPSGGSVTSANNFDAIELVCLVTDTTWGLRGPVTAAYLTA